MKCEEFEAMGLGLDRENPAGSGTDAVERAAVIEHVSTCARCAALQESWQGVQTELRALRAATQEVSAPPRVEMRLRQEFRTRHRAVKARTAAVAAAWALAAAAMLMGAVSLRNWYGAQHQPATQGVNSAAGDSTAVKTPPAVQANGVAGENGKRESANATTLVADNNDYFTALPGSLPQDTDGSTIVRVRLQRGALGALGLPVNQERAGEWIQVDLLVGEDGQPQAVRLLR